MADASSTSAEARRASGGTIASQLERRLSELMAEDHAEGGYSSHAHAAGELTSQREVWYEYINSDTSAMAVKLPDSESALNDADGERLIWKPGLEGWTPMREVLSNPEAMSSDSTTREAGEPLQQASGPTVGTPYNVARWKPQFGLPLEACETTTVNGYQIPSILVLLWRTLKANGGHLEEGIFRISADNEECKDLVAQLNVSGDALSRIGSHTNAHTLSNLIPFLPLGDLGGSFFMSSRGPFSCICPYVSNEVALRYHNK